ncbi:MAG: bifunctional demethylmenaquinone methyltransferase/2-methoxy-6-polyprenyl-1,4-benzoquinol methylase UbiE [Bacteroidales bacterium]|nr:bifunctional demethylmenaquinone methyltransferase/2-methoxy-6-polyprenyl-1,4-benzoquinol methylase UbiE [Bacteroidales bacterium]
MPQKKKIGAMFDRIAGSYDRLNHVLSFRTDRAWRRRSLRHVLDGQPLRILDLACGTGDYAICMARKATPGTHITGVDLSEGMLRVMAAKVADAGLDGMVTCRCGEAERLDFPDGSFDRVTVAFGVRNFEDRQAALREIRRVLSPGGRLVILELSQPRNVLIRAIFNLYFHKIAPLIGGMVSGDREAYRYLPASVAAFPPPEEWTAFMRDCGFSRVQHKAYTFGVCRLYIGEK